MDGPKGFDVRSISNVDHDPAVDIYAVPASEFLKTQLKDSDREAVAVGGLIFARSEAGSGDLRLLLVQRAASDGIMAGLWEVPGGGCEASDPTTLHSLVREIFEETGLHANRILRKVGADDYFQSRSGRRIVKLNFEVEVEELRQQSGKENESPTGSILVELAPAEHQSFSWATEDMLDDYQWAHAEMKKTVVNSFRRRKGEHR